ncbi:MAG: hypothetical protein IPL43_01365 [Micropruina sp.]|nr:hypothetical protein [Micropruina sp.]
MSTSYSAGGSAHQKNLSQSILQVIFSFFLGVVVVAFVGIGVNTFYPEPAFTDGSWDDARHAGWRLTTSVILLICATAVMVVSLVRSELAPVISNGILLGGVFTMIYAVGVSASAGNEWPRFVVITFALLVTVGIGYLKFARVRASAEAPANLSPDGSAPLDSAIGVRLEAVEAKLDALGKVLRGE